MRILVISDIHANLDALEACLEAAPPFDQVFNLGDIVGYGANPNEVVERSRALGHVFVRGNHDKACSGLTNLAGFNPIAGLAARWTQQMLTPENQDFLRALPRGPVWAMENVNCVHGSADDEDEYVLLSQDALPLLQRSTRQITFFGHSHIQCSFFIERLSRFQGAVPAYPDRTGEQQFEFRLKPDARYLINPGSIGQPRDGDPRAAFLLYDADESLITFYRVPYDIAAAQKKILAGGLPPRLAERLAEGR
ncbi:MAG TPA: metallophosphoesterase family protein [Candidatus Saccharimonadales bacterium]|nr:metallophosphoesterase family protein [Candidatus Saccharimonadales bacterium]